MANSNGWGDGASNNDIGWGQGADNAIGWGAIYADSWAGATDIVGTPAVDPDAQAFITAASITDPTQQSAINQLVVDLKGYGVWTKMKALYPFVGGTAAQHKWNLKDPRDLDAAFRLTFVGGLTHSSTGIKGNGTNGYFRTYLLANTDLPQNTNASGAYIRTNVAEDTIDYGFINNSGHTLSARLIGNLLRVRNYGNTTDISNSDSRGFYQTTRRNSSGFVIAQGTTKTSNSVASVSTISNVESFGLACNFAGPQFYSSRELAFHYYANSSMSDTELDNLYTAVQAFQTTLGRSIGTQTVSDADAQAFVTNAGIVDQVEANAINNLVIGLKADSLWTKMKAVYPMVGGSSSTMKYNLVNPLDTDAAFRLVFNGGWTFSSNGALPNGTNAYADTKLNTSTILTNNSGYLDYYSRTNTAISSEIPIGNINGTSGTSSFHLVIRRDNNLNSFRATASGSFVGIASSTTTDSRGLTSGSITSATSRKLFKNGSLIATDSVNNTWDRANANIYIGAANRFENSIADYYTNKECAFASIGDGLTDTDAANLYNRVQTFNTALARQV